MATTVRLANGTEFPCLGASSRSVYYQGIQRDSLTFFFDLESVNFLDLANEFQGDNCSVIYINVDGEDFAHNYYQIQHECGVANYSAVADGPVSSDGDFRCLYVKMLQTTMSERMLIAHDEAIDDLVISILEG